MTHWELRLTRKVLTSELRCGKRSSSAVNNKIEDNRILRSQETTEKLETVSFSCATRTSRAAPSQLRHISWLRGSLNIVGMCILLSVAQPEAVFTRFQGQVEELVVAYISTVASASDC